MQVKSNYLTYDDQDPRCKLHIIAGIAYLEVLDPGADHCPYEVPEIKRYCGPWDWENPIACTQGIIKYGRKWETLPEA